ncbi:hypothetical protein C7M84_000386 [Penaeus vannamei]|uniref:Vesicle transport protein GOT1B n=1 Tax=Penaeus vannamei TaxID=6689 RepID=A0A3R7N9I1_PENVA|nr:hypothetical protein C7M84_000386 [Penaeus vannamei]
MLMCGADNIEGELTTPCRGGGRRGEELTTPWLPLPPSQAAFANPHLRLIFDSQTFDLPGDVIIFWQAIEPKIGVGFAAFGVTFIFLGVILFFDKGLLAIGNILFLAGLAFVVGLERTFRFFFQRHKWKGSGAFFGGILTVLLGWPLIGMCVEVYGFVILFSGFFPVAVNFLRRMPVIGQLLNLPFISGFVDRIGGDSKMNV